MFKKLHQQAKRDGVVGGAGDKKIRLCKKLDCKQFVSGRSEFVFSGKFLVYPCFSVNGKITIQSLRSLL